MARMDRVRSRSRGHCRSRTHLGDDGQRVADKRIRRVSFRLGFERRQVYLVLAEKHGNLYTDFDFWLGSKFKVQISKFKTRKANSALSTQHSALIILPAVFILLCHYEYNEARAVGMGQYQDFDLLVCRLAAVCRVCFGLDL